MSTLLNRLDPKFMQELELMEQPQKAIVIQILNSEKYFVELKLRECFQLQIFFNLKSINEVINLFE